jgi:FkbM family methyltransferase
MLRSAAYWYRVFPRLSHALLRKYQANYEREMELLDVLCDGSRTGIDVGAKVGMYTYRLLTRCSDVIAFEPVPLFSRMLERVFARSRCRVEPYALSNGGGDAILRMPYRANGGPELGRSTIEPANPLAHPGIDHFVALRVETRRLDDYALQNVGFVKIDVEGHEVAVLDGAEETLRVSRPNMLIECNDDHQPNGTANLARWLSAHDYTGDFAVGPQLLPIERFVRTEHWERQRIENFICVHRSRPDVREAVRARVLTLPVR